MERRTMAPVLNRHKSHVILNGWNRTFKPRFEYRAFLRFQHVRPLEVGNYQA